MAKQDDLEIVIGADLSGLASDLAQTRKMFQGLARDIERSAPSSRDFAPRVDTAVFNRLSGAAKGAGLSVRSLTADVAGFGAKLAITGGSLLALEAGLNGVGSALEHVKSSVVMAAEFEQNQIAFETMLGSAQKAAEVMADLRKFAAETPFSSKDVTDSARKLLAYGFAAEDLIPSLKTIGTLAAGVSRPLGELTYNVGTTRTQGRAQQIDINQLTEKGIEIYPALAKELKVEQAEVKKLVEEGRVDWNTYKKAVESVANVKFGGMLAKQADSLKGSWEQMTDAFDRSKLKLGQVIAQEVGLRGAAKDLEGFAGNIERALDGERFRGAVRLVGELAKGGGQLAYEFGRVAVEVGKINLDGLEHVSPQFKTLTRDIQQFVTGLKDFKFDKRSIASAGLTVFEMVAEPIAGLIDYANVEGRAFADAINRNFVQPFKDVGRAAEQARDWMRESWLAKAGKGISDADDWIGKKSLGRDAWERQRAIIDQASIDRAYLRDRNVDRPAAFKAAFPAEQITDGRDNKYEAALRAMADVVKFGDPGDQLRHHFYPPKDWEPKEQVWRRYDTLQSRIADAEKLIKEDDLKQLEPYLKNLRDAEAAFVAPYSSPQWGMGAARRRLADFRRVGDLPPRRDDYAEPAPAPPPKTNVESVRERRLQFGAMLFDGLARDDIRDHFGKMFTGIRKDEASALKFGTAVSLAGLGPFGSAAPDVSARDADRLALPATSGLNPHQMELAKKVKDEFDPLAKLNRDLADLDGLFKAGGISRREYDFARNKEVRGLADSLGLNQPAKLPDTVQAGTQEDARLLARALAVNPQQTTEALLKTIADHLFAIRNSNKNMEQAPAPKPANVSLPGKG